MIPINKLVEKYSDKYLIVDGVYPIVTSSTINDEASLYMLSEKKIDNCMLDFQNVTNKKIDHNTLTTELSFGQKIILSMLLAVYSDAENIFFHKVKSSIDSVRQEKINYLIKNKFNTKMIMYSDE